jgi:CheY-like chemotaxis protein
MAINKILIVDDEPVLNEMITERLELTGYDTVSAYDGIQAFEKAKSEAPDIILLDMTLPPEGGQAVYENLKQDSSTGNIPVLIITAEIPNKLQRFLDEKGIPESDVFLKPLDFQALKLRISSV